MAYFLQLQTFSLNGLSVSLYVPLESEVREAYQKGELTSPFWTQVWPSSQALALYLVDHPALIQDKKVLEIGAGLGLPSLVAAQKAASVLCTDYSNEAVETAQKSAQYHSLKNFHALVIDWHHLPPETEADVLLLSDINYDPEAFNALQRMINMFLLKNTTIVLATPQRLMAKEFITPLLSFCKQQQEIEILHQHSMTKITVLVFKKGVNLTA